MKLITLIPFKNECAMLPTAISSVKTISDEIIAINDNSNDGSDILAKNLGVKVYNNNDLIDYGWPELNIRKKLLNLGRDHNGTHFICLDADEAISSNFKNNLDILSILKPGDKLLFQWLAMWKSFFEYKNDSSIWSNNFKDFLFYDNGKLDFPNIWMHTPRTPGENRIDNNYKISIDKGAVLHFQFSNWECFQIKQCWYRCSELIMNNGNNINSINEKYKITLEDKNTKLSKLDHNLFYDIILPNDDEIRVQSNWRLEQIKNWFIKYGINFFNKLDIWHVDQIKNLKLEFENA